MSALIHELWSAESGATAVEYALMAAMIAAAIIGVVLVLGQQVNASLGSVIGFGS